jgi:hypothetical protein
VAIIEGTCLAMMTKSGCIHIKRPQNNIGLDTRPSRVLCAPCWTWKTEWRSRWEELFRESSHDARAQQSCEHENKQNPNDLQHVCLFQRWHRCDAERTRWLLPNPSKPASSSELSAKRSGSISPKHSSSHRLPPISCNNTLHSSG